MLLFYPWLIYTIVLSNLHLHSWFAHNIRCVSTMVSFSKGITFKSEHSPHLWVIVYTTLSLSKGTQYVVTFKSRLAKWMTKIIPHHDCLCRFAPCLCWIFWKYGQKWLFRAQIILDPTLDFLLSSSLFCHFHCKLPFTCLLQRICCMCAMNRKQ